MVLALMATLLASVAACNYNVGNGYPAEIRSVYVPIFKNETYRRGIEFQLTEAVHKQIQQRTPFRLVHEPLADTRLTGCIRDVRKRVLGETKFDDPRELELTLVVDIVWEDVRNGGVLYEGTMSLGPAEAHLVSQAQLAPEVGQSLATAYQTAIDRLSRQIVDKMEAPW